jgi:acetyl esterase/lipase
MNARSILTLAWAISASALLLAAAPAPPAATSVATTVTIPPGGAQRVKLWAKAPGTLEGRDTDADPLEPTMDIFLAPAGKETGAAVLIFPGGGYTNLAVAKEGYDVAKVFNASNIAGFVVRYRHGNRYRYPTPLLDAQRALRTVRAKAVEYKIDPNRIGILGFSAGGHLAAMSATMFDTGPKPENPDAIDTTSAKPNFAILMYPVITLTDEALVHKGSRTALTNNNPELYAQLSPEQHVPKDAPPMFFVHGGNDRTVPVMNSVLMYQACLKAGIPAELHILEEGSHGFGLGPNDPILKTWPDMAIRWLDHHKLLTAK